MIKPNSVTVSDRFLYNFQNCLLFGTTLYSTQMCIDFIDKVDGFISKIEKTAPTTNYFGYKKHDDGKVWAYYGNYPDEYTK